MSGLSLPTCLYLEQDLDGCLVWIAWLLKLSWGDLREFSTPVRWELHWRKLSLLQCPAYLTNSGNPRYPGVSLRVVIWVLFAEKDVNFLIIGVVLLLHPGCWDECGLCKGRICLPKCFTVYSAVQYQWRICDENSFTCENKAKPCRGVDWMVWGEAWAS